MPLLPSDITDLVRSDGQPREATADDGSQHMVWREGELIRSCLLTDWPVEQQARARREAVRAKRAALRDSLRGKQADVLTLPELRDVVAVLLERAGMVDDDGAIV